ncbi:MAG: nuclear transport factor 2 family protein [Candidatus Limnocylindrales bacterium]
MTETAAVRSADGRRTASLTIEHELTRVERGFAAAIVANDPVAIGRFVTDDWIIVDADGGIVSKDRFLEVIGSGDLVHTRMESDDVRVRVHGACAVVTAVIRTAGTYLAQPFSTQERATDVLVRLDGRWRCILTQLTRSPDG